MQALTLLLRGTLSCLLLLTVVPFPENVHATSAVSKRVITWVRDTAFNGDGQAAIPIVAPDAARVVASARWMERQPSGKLLLSVGDRNNSIRIVRLGANWEPDDTFALGQMLSTGVVTGTDLRDVSGLTMLSDGRIFVVSRNRSSLPYVDNGASSGLPLDVIQYSADGARVSTQSVDSTEFYLRGVPMLDGGMYLLTGQLGVCALVVRRIKPNGEIDVTYGANGQLRLCQISGFANARAIAGGLLFLTFHLDQSTTESARILRVRADGAVDETYGVTGEVRVSRIKNGSMLSAIDGGGRIAITEAIDAFSPKVSIPPAEVRIYSPAGAPEQQFVRPPTLRPYVFTSLVWSPDGALLIRAASETFRLTTTGSLDTEFGDPDQAGKLKGAGMQLVFGDAVTGSIIFARTAVDLDGTPLGPTTFRFYTLQGRPDLAIGSGGVLTLSTFLPAPSVRTPVGAVMLPDGSTLLSAKTNVGLNEQIATLIKFRRDGTLDPSFGSGGIVDTDMALEVPSSPSTVLPGVPLSQPFLVTQGKFLLLRSIQNGYLIRGFMPDGSVDKTFGISGTIATVLPTLGSRFVVRQAQLDMNGKLVVSGYSGTDVPYVGLGNLTFWMSRHLPNGALDPEFNGTGIQLNAFDTSGLTIADVYTPKTTVAIAADHIDIAYSGIAPSVNAGDVLTDSILVYRLKSNGTGDGTYGTGGKAVLPVGPTLCPGCIYRPSPSMSLSFSTRGELLITNPIYANSGNGAARLLAIKLRSDGRADMAFGDGGLLTLVDYVFAYGIPETDGGWLLFGRDGLRLTAEGTVDIRYGTAGVFQFDELDVPFANQYPGAPTLPIVTQDGRRVFAYVLSGLQTKLIRYVEREINVYEVLLPVLSRQ